METTVAKALAVLEILAASDSALRVAEIAAAAGLTRSNAHRLLRTLVELGYVAQEEDTVRYAPTLKAWEIGAKTLNALPMKRAAVSVLHQLNAATGESTVLYILEGFEVLCLDRIAGARPQQRLAMPGDRATALYPSSGRAILANRSDGLDLARRIAEHEATDPKIDLEALFEDFERIRQRGFAIALGGWTPGINSVAAVIRDRPEPIAAISIGGASNRVTPERLQTLGEMIVPAARRIEALLTEE